MSKSRSSLCVSFSRTGAVLCINNLLVWSNLNFLHISQWITLPTQSCLVLYSVFDNFLHSLIMWLIVSSLSLHSLHLLFCYVFLLLFTHLECSTSVLADSFQLEFDRKQIPSLQCSSHYSHRSQKCNDLDGLHSSSYFQALQSLY